MTASVPASHDAFHAHLDAWDRCRRQPFNLYEGGSVLLEAVKNDDGETAASIAPDPTKDEAS